MHHPQHHMTHTMHTHQGTTYAASLTTALLALCLLLFPLAQSCTPAQSHDAPHTDAGGLSDTSAPDKAPEHAEPSLPEKDSAQDSLEKVAPDGAASEGADPDSDDTDRSTTDATTPDNTAQTLTVKFLSTSTDVIGTQGSGKETATLRFQVVDAKQNPAPSGATILFAISKTIGGANVSPKSAKTDSKGEVQVTLTSGQIAATVTVTATLQTPTQSATSPPIAIVGGTPNHAFMTFDCRDRNIGGLYGATANKNPVRVDTDCSVRLADRFSNKIGFSTQLHFLAEAGAIGATAQTIAYQAGTANKNMGITTTVATAQNPHPVDVDPMQVPNVKNCGNAPCSIPDPKVSSQHLHAWKGYDCTASITGKTLYVEPFYKDSTGRIRNPRDGLVTLVAYTNGEEEFTDLNGNGQYDKGEPFIDLGEPFVDANDNNRYDATLPGLPGGERFVDRPCTQDEVTKGTNGCTKVGIGNGKRDGPNGMWDGDTLIWKKTWILWTGCAVLLDSSKMPIEPTVRLDRCKKEQFHSGIYPDPATSPQPWVFELTYHDQNLNPLTPASTAYYTPTGHKLQQSPAPPHGSSAGLADLGFTIITRKEPLALPAQSVADWIVHSSFFGLDSISHRLTVLNLNPQIPVKQIQIDIVLTSQAKNIAGKRRPRQPNICANRFQIKSSP